MSDALTKPRAAVPITVALQKAARNDLYQSVHGSANPIDPRALGAETRQGLTSGAARGFAQSLDQPRSGAGDYLSGTLAGSLLGGAQQAGEGFLQQRAPWERETTRTGRFMSAVSQAAQEMQEGGEPAGLKATAGKLFSKGLLAAISNPEKTLPEERRKLVNYLATADIPTSEAMDARMGDYQALQQFASGGGRDASGIMQRLFRGPLTPQSIQQQMQFAMGGPESQAHALIKRVTQHAPDQLTRDIASRMGSILQGQQRRMQTTGQYSEEDARDLKALGTAMSRRLAEVGKAQQAMKALREMRANIQERADSTEGLTDEDITKQMGLLTGRWHVPYKTDEQKAQAQVTLNLISDILENPAQMGQANVQRPR
jgi:hypothetical protein